MTENQRLCEICNTPIDLERVEILPETQLCTSHAHKILKFGGEFLTSFHQERTSKPGSLKINYGGVTMTKKRNYEGLKKLRAEYERERLLA
jgi:hypothetical protein